MKFLDRFKTAAKPAQQEGDTEMSQTTEVVASVDAPATDNKVAELSAALAAKETLVAEMHAKMEALTAQMAALETEKVSLADKAKAVVQAARKEKLEAVLGTVGAAPVLATMEGADDTTFETVLSAFAVNREAESKSKMFQDQGVAAEVEVPAEEADTATRLAAKMAAQFKIEGK